MISARARRRLEQKPVRARAVRPVLEALVALVVFVGRFEIGPTLHQIAHGSLDAHVREDGGLALEARRDTATTASPTHDSVSCDDARRTHGHDNVAHRGVLFLDAPSQTPLVPVSGFVGRLEGERVRTERERRLAIVHVARGPPCTGAHETTRRPRA